MNNIPKVKLGIVAVSRDCFPVELSRNRRDQVILECRKKKIAIKAMETFLMNFHKTGDIRLYLNDMASLDERSQLLGLNEFYELEKKFLSGTGE